jgi:hypothetical protein
MSLPEQIDLGDGFVLDRARVGDAAETARAIHESLDHLALTCPRRPRRARLGVRRA